MPRSSGTKLYMRRAAQSARVRSQLQGSKSVRRLLKSIPDEMRLEMAHALEDVGPKLTRAMQANAPSRTGALRAGIKWKVLRRSLRLQVGLLGSKRGRAKLFYGYILNFNRKGQSVFTRRKTNSGKVSTYTMRVKYRKGDHFVTGRYPDLRNMTTAKLRGIWDRVLTRVSARAGDE